MGLEVPPDQRQVVITSCGLNFSTNLSQPIHVAIGGEVFSNQATSLLVIRLLNQNLHHAVQGGRQLFQLLTLTCLDLLQLLLGAFVDRGDSSDEHLGQVISGSHPHTVDQSKHQRVTLRQRAVLQFRYIRRRSLGSKVANFRIDDPIKNGIQFPETL